MAYTRLDRWSSSRSCSSCRGAGYDPRYPGEHRCCGSCGGSGVRGGRAEAERMAKDYAKDPAYWDKEVI